MACNIYSYVRINIITSVPSAVVCTFMQYTRRMLCTLRQHSFLRRCPNFRILQKVAHSNRNHNDIHCTVHRTIKAARRAWDLSVLCAPCQQIFGDIRNAVDKFHTLENANKFCHWQHSQLRTLYYRRWWTQRMRSTIQFKCSQKRHANDLRLVPLLTNQIPRCAFAI